ncbi:MAG TPA: hypothetical protein VKA84_16015 [Gemmatimonadaceae bacterium]|nr:hypothetical protein [Gemmatimonadaceae bacterium]
MTASTKYEVLGSAAQKPAPEFRQAPPPDDTVTVRVALSVSPQ